MPCGCGRTYIVNDYGFSNRRRKDKSFKSFITFLLMVLLMWIVIYCIILTYNHKNSDNLHHSNSSKENLHGSVDKTTTKNPALYKSITKIDVMVSSSPNNLETSTETLHDALKGVTKSPDSTTKTLSEIEGSTDLMNTFETSKSDLDLKAELNNKTFKQNTEETITIDNITNNITELMGNEIATENVLVYGTVQDHNNNKTVTVTEFNDLTEHTTSKKTIAEQDKTTVFTNKNKFDINLVTTTEADKITTQNNSKGNKIFSEQNTFNKVTEEDIENFTASNTDLTTAEELITKKNLPSSTVSVTELLQKQTETHKPDEITELYYVKFYVKEDTSYVVTEPPIPKTSVETVTVTETSSSYDSLANKIIGNSPSARSKSYSGILTDPMTTPNNLKYITESDKIQTPLKYNIETTSVDGQIGTDQTTLRYIDNHTMSSTSNVLANRVGVTTDSMESQNELHIVTEKVEKRQCTSSDCKDKASQILQLMDHSVDPCDDFYQFSCGGLKHVEEFENFKEIDLLLKVLYTSTESDNKYLKNLQKFFNSCIKYENDYGYSTKLNQVLSSTTRDKNLTTLLSFLMLRQSTPLFDVQYGLVGEKEGYGIQILPPNSNYESTGLKDWSLQSLIKKKCLYLNPSLKYQSEINLPSVYESYTSCKTTTFKKIAEDFVFERTKIPNNPIVKELLGFFSKMNNVSEPTLQDAILHQKYTKINVDDLNQKYPQINWPYFFDIITDKTFNKSTPIYLYLEKEYFQQIMKDLKDRMLKTEKEVMTSLKLYYQLELYQSLLIPKQNKEQFCMNQAIQLMPEIATQILYKNSALASVSSSSAESIYSKINNVFAQLKTRFYWLIEVSMLEEANKKMYKSSLEELKLKMFNDDAEWNNYLHRSYESSYLQDDYLSNVFMFIENKRKVMYTSHSDKEEFLFVKFLDSQFSKIPELVPNTNTVAIPNTFLYKILEIEQNPAYVVESYLKFHLSRAIALYLHELGRKFNSGFHYLFINNLNAYLENEDDIKMLKGQRITYRLQWEDWRKVVQFSEKTRMADNIALDLTFGDMFIQNTTFKELPWIEHDYSPEEQFFLIVSQEYCEISTIPSLAQNFYETQNIPSTFRIDNMMMNSKVFSKTFQCPQGTKMNPEDKIQFDDFVPDIEVEYEVHK